jgi:hypothetical protein
MALIGGSVRCVGPDCVHVSPLIVGALALVFLAVLWFGLKWLHDYMDK